MKHLIKTLLIVLFVPFASTAQVQFQRTSSSTITDLLPFYSQSLLNGTQVVNFPFTRPTITQGGVPTNLNIDSTYDDLDDTTYETKPIFDFGRVINTTLTLSNGNWQTTSYGSVWCLNISINDALNTSVYFDELTLSPSAKFYILNSEINMLKGPYTKDAVKVPGIFGTFPMNGSSCYLFLQDTIPANISQNALTISGVVAGVQTIGDDFPGGSSARVANSCIPSIRCYDSHVNTARAVSRWSNGEGSLCSGTLLNNENNDGTSYYYSAQHCLPGNQLNLRRASFQFRYWQTGCNTNTDLNGIEFTGATLLNEVPYNDGDAILLRLTDGPGVGDAAVYAGWSRQNSNPSQSQSAIIHHPDGGDMRFTKARYVRDFLWDNDFWKASYSTGVMLGGSSGSALLNENQQVIGALSRGTSSCFWNFLGDRFGKFHQGWGGMQQFLSPNQNLFSIGTFTVNAVITGPGSLGCSSGAQQFSVPNLAGCTYTWTVSSNLTIQSGQNTSSISVVYSGSNQPVDIGTVTVVINDSKGTVPNGRRVQLTKDIYTGNTISGVVMQSGYSNKAMYTVNSIRPNILSHTEFTSFSATSTGAVLVSGTPQYWSFGNNGNYGHLYVTLANGQSASFDITTTTSNCGVFKRTVTYYGSTSSWRFIAAPNPAKDVITIEPVKDENTLSKAKASELEYSVNLIDFQTGRTVKQQKVGKGQGKSQLNVANLKRGQYVLQINEGKNSTSQHIILE